MIRRFQSTYPSIHIDMQELTSVQQVTALREGSIDVGFGRLHVEDPTIQREVLIEEPLVVALPIGHSLLDRAEPLTFAALISAPLIVYPVAPRPSYADQVLSLLKQRGLKPALVREVRELQTALGLVAAGVGVVLFPMPFDASGVMKFSIARFMMRRRHLQLSCFRAQVTSRPRLLSFSNLFESCIEKL
jgi:DNA-binding transcriptional LysR family regulator